MKRTAALFLMAALIFAVFASAAPEDASKGTQTLSALSLSYEDIEDQVLKNNPTVKSNKNTLENMKHPDGLIAARNNLFTQAAKIEMSVSGMIAALEGKATSNLMQLSFAANSLKAQAQTMKAPEKEEIEETGWQLDQVNCMLVTAVQSMYVSYLSTERQLEDMRQSAAVMDRNLEAMKLRYELGQVTILDLEALENQRKSLRSAISSLESGLKTLKGEINMQLGRAFDAPLELKPLASPDLTYAEKLDRPADLQKAKNASYALKLKRRAIDDADDTEYEDQKYNTFKRDYENKVMDANTEEETIRFTQAKLIDAMDEKKRALDIEQDQLELEKDKLAVSELKYDLGEISEIDLLSARLSLGSQEVKVQNASDALSSAIQTYKWLLRGIYSSSSASPSGSTGQSPSIQ